MLFFHFFLLLRRQDTKLHKWNPLLNLFLVSLGAFVTWWHYLFQQIMFYFFQGFPFCFGKSF